MKKNDLALIILIVAITLLTSYFIAKAVIGEPKTKPVKVDKIIAIQPDFPEPDPRVFNSKALDPTVDISIGGQSANNDPFISNSQSQ